MKTEYPNPAYIGREDGLSHAMALVTREEIDTHCTRVIVRLMQRYWDEYWPETEAAIRLTYSEFAVEEKRIEFAFTYARYFVDGALQFYAMLDITTTDFEGEMARIRAKAEQSPPS